MDSSSHSTAAREALTQLEQTRWVLGNLLEEKDLRSTWPIRVMLTDSADALDGSCSFKAQTRDDNDLSLAPWHESERAAAFLLPRVLHGQFLLVCQPGARLPLGEIAGILLDSNTPLLPPEVESGVRSLFDTLEAKGSRVTWGGAPPHPDLAWARMQLFATKFEYSASFHIFLTALKSGSTLRAAEQNAFGQPSEALEREAAARLAQRTWQPSLTSGRPLDPRRDFGEHALEAGSVSVYLADESLLEHASPAELKNAEQTFTAASQEDGPAAALGFEGLGQIAQVRNDSPSLLLEKAIHAKTHSAPVYLASATDLPPEQAIARLRHASLLNPLWSEPLAEEALLTEDAGIKETLLKKATVLNRRDPQLWIQLAKVQTEAGHASAAQGSWFRAEDAAPNASIRDAIHKARLASEEGRLDAAEKQREHDRDSAYYADQHAQAREAGRIHEAEKRANSAASSAAAPDNSTNVAEPVPWQDMAQQKTLEGTLVRVECSGTSATLTVKSRSGLVMNLLLSDIAKSPLSCSNPTRALRVTLTYIPRIQESSGVSGEITSLNLWKGR